MQPFDEYIAEIGARLRRRRLAAGLSLRTLGLMVDVHYNQLQRIEQGKVNPSLHTLYRISEGLGIDLADLLSQSKEDPHRP